MYVEIAKTLHLIRLKISYRIHRAHHTKQHHIDRRYNVKQGYLNSYALMNLARRLIEERSKFATVYSAI